MDANVAYLAEQTLKEFILWSQDTGEKELLEHLRQNGELWSDAQAFDLPFDEYDANHHDLYEKWETTRHRKFTKTAKAQEIRAKRAQEIEDYAASVEQGKVQFRQAAELEGFKHPCWLANRVALEVAKQTLEETQVLVQVLIQRYLPMENGRPPPARIRGPGVTLQASVYDGLLELE